MPSSTQFSIRGLMVITVVVATLSATLAPTIRQLDPPQRIRGALSLAVLGVVSGAVVGETCLRRRRVEKAAGRLLLRTEVGGAGFRWVSLGGAIPLAAIAIYIAVFIACIDPFEYGFMIVVILGLFVLSLAFAAIGLVLYWWWGTGFLMTEAFENGIVVRGLAFLPWSDLASYETNVRKTTICVLNQPGKRGSMRRVRVFVAIADRIAWEQILLEHGVPRANPD